MKSDKYFFSPGPVPIEAYTNITYSHRSEEFQELYRDTVTKLTAMTSNRYKTLLIQGSATAAIESVVSSMSYHNKEVLILVNGTFSHRMKEMLNAYYIYSTTFTQLHELEAHVESNPTSDYLIFVVQFETSKSIYNNLTRLEQLRHEQKFTLIVDTVSAFPYYNVPDCDAFITSSSKQLSGLPVMGIVFYSESFKDKLLQRNYYLSLLRYIDSSEIHSTPHTSLIPQVQSLHDIVQHFDPNDNKAMIDRNCDCFTGIQVSGEHHAPVLTFEFETDISELIQELRSNGYYPYYNRVYMDKVFQLSMFSYSDVSIYESVANIIKKFNK